MKKIYLMFLLLGLLIWEGCAYTPSGTQDASSKVVSGDLVISGTSISNIFISSPEKSSEESASLLEPMTPSATREAQEDGYYSYDANGRWIRFSLRDDKHPSSIPAEAYLPEEELHRRAEEYLKDKIPIDQYEIKYNENMPSMQQIKLLYYRKVKGFTSFDFASVTVTYGGTIIDFYAPRIGIFDSIDEASIPEINEGKLQERLTSLMKEQFGDVDYTEYPEKRILSIMEDGSFAMYMVALPDGMDETYTWSFYVPIE